MSHPCHQHPELFDLPGDTRPRKIFRATHTTLVSKPGQKKRWKHFDTYINAPSYKCAERVAKNWLTKVHRQKLNCLVELTWDEYAATFENIPGVKVTYKNPSARAHLNVA